MKKLRMSKGLNMAIVRAFERSSLDKIEYLTLEHLLFGLLDDQDVLELLEQEELDIMAIQAELEHLLQEQRAALTRQFTPKGPRNQPVPTVALHRVLHRAFDKKIAVDDASSISTLEVLCEILEEKGSDASNLLQEMGLDSDMIVSFIDQNHGEGTEEEGDDGEFYGEIRQVERGETPNLEPENSKGKGEAFTTNLNEEVKAGRIDPIIGRNEELERVMQVICRRRKNNPLLIGEAGVGKTAIAEGLAYKIVNNAVPEVLKDFEVYSLDLGAMLAGTHFRGDFEDRLKKLIKEFEKKPKSILFLDEIHQMLGAGSSGSEGGAGDAATLLKPALAKGNLRVIGASTYDEVRKIMSRDSALMRRFQKIDVSEPTKEETKKILEGLKDRFEKFHGVKYEQEAIEAAVDLSQRYINDRKLPDKAIDLLDEAGSNRRLHPKEGVTSIGKKEIEIIVAKLANIPPQSVSSDDKKRLKNLASNLKKVIFGQDEAVETLTDSIKLARSGLGKTDRPIGSFLFSGPTGVGKTELARQLAKELGISLIRFDMSEYMERHTVSRLIGAPPGYVGFDQGGLLTEAVNKKPHSVLLLDEIEKAHPDIFNILLQVMDHGSLTDNNGRTADFRNVILVMTTNAGAQDLSKSSIGFLQLSHDGDEQREIKKTFTPEFRNRLDAVVSFKSLGKDEITLVVDKFLNEIKEQLKLKQVDASFSHDLKQYLADKGFDPLMGARPMGRLIQTTIRKVLADELLFGKLSKGGSVLVGIDAGGKTTLSVKPKSRTRASVAKPKALVH